MLLQLLALTVLETQLFSERVTDLAGSVDYFKHGQMLIERIPKSDENPKFTASRKDAQILKGLLRPL